MIPDCDGIDTYELSTGEIVYEFHLRGQAKPIRVRLVRDLAASLGAETAETLERQAEKESA